LSAIVRKKRARDLTTSDYRKAIRQFESDWKNLYVINLKNDILPALKNTILKYSLRGADAIHLASALYFGFEAREKVTTVTSDEELLLASKKARLLTINPAE